jgi:hypothetical protein
MASLLYKRSSFKKPIFLFCNKRTVIYTHTHTQMTCIQRVYANGSYWVALDRTAQSDIETLWSINSSYWILCPSVFKNAVYVDVKKMVMLCNGYSYTIARRRA